MRRVGQALRLVAALLVLAAAAVIVFTAYVARLMPTTPGIEQLLQAQQRQRAQPSVLLSANGTRLATFSRGYQESVGLDEISPWVLQALIATEDHRFYDHAGIDIRRTATAMVHTLLGNTQGGSTITQQLVRNLFPEEIGRVRNLERKLREMITAWKIEQTLSKHQILEAYLNTVPFLYQVSGIEMAARTYFDKSAADLDARESATLIGMLKGTSYYNPVINPARALQRRNVVLWQMVKHNKLSAKDYAALRDLPLQLRFQRRPEPLGQAPHFAAHVQRQMLAWAKRHGVDLTTEGLIIESTLDDELQQAALDAVARQTEMLQAIAAVEWSRREAHVRSESPKRYVAARDEVEPFDYFWKSRAALLDTFIRETPQYKTARARNLSDTAALARLKSDDRVLQELQKSKTRLESGFVAIDPGSGEVKAWVGSRNFDVDQFDHVAQAVRQPGSTFKPFVYGAAMELGMSPDFRYEDGLVKIVSADGSVWRPTDMGGPSGRMMSLREGLIFSKNTITAQVMRDVGLANVAALAEAAGINRSRLRLVPSLALGTSPVTLLEMASAYSTIAELGLYRAPQTIKRIRNRQGKLLAEFNTEEQYALSEETAVELIDMMRGVIDRGTGSMVKQTFRLRGDLAGKTGTTQNNTDGWFILMHRNLVAGAWVGFNDARVTMRSNYWGQGGHNAALLVGDFFRQALETKRIDASLRFPPSRLQPPPPRPRVLAEAQPQPTWPDPVEDVDTSQLPASHGVVTTRDGSTILVIGPDGILAVQRRPSNAVDSLHQAQGSSSGP